MGRLALRGMAITDELLTDTEGSVEIVGRRSAPGGHWLEAYPFVRLQQVPHIARPALAAQRG